MRNILYYLSTACISQNVQNKIYNLQIRLEQFTDQTKKAKKFKLVGLALSYMTILKARIIHKSCLSLGTFHKHMQFTETTITIYWYAKRNKLSSLNMPVLNTIQ